MGPMHTAIYRVLQDIPEAGHARGDLLLLQLVEGPGERRAGPEVMEVIRWLGQGWVEEVSLGPSAQW